MPHQRGKRPYRPKVRGCYECSQRRVSCDRNVPECGKCVAKGLKCSGFSGKRYRFAHGVTTRGRRAGETIQSLCEKEWSSGGSKPKSRKATSHIKKDDQGPQNTEIASELSPISLNFLQELHPVLLESMDLGNKYPSSVAPHPTPMLLEEDSPGRDTFNSEDDLIPDYHSSYSSLNELLNQCLLQSIPTWKKKLLLHYSDNIAKEMVAIDGRFNGWRYIVLPLAHADDLVMDAVLTASAFHRIATQAHESKLLLPGLIESNYSMSIDATPSPQSLYNATIRGLQQRSNLARSSDDPNQATLVAVLVLLVAAMVSGRDDYVTILDMLQSATNFFGGEYELGSSEVGSFLVRQVRKMKVYAAPYISEWAGLDTLTSQSKWDQYFDCVRYCSEGQSENAVAVAGISGIMQQAHDIYLEGVTESIWPITNEQATVRMDDRIQRFKETLEQLPDDASWSRVLVWATFLVAAASSSKAHRSFFKAALRNHYKRSRFLNLLRGIQHLPHMWAKKDAGVRWTQLLSEAQLYLM